MRKRALCGVLPGVAILMVALYFGGSLMATPQNSGYKSSTMASGRFDDINVFTQAVVPASQDKDTTNDGDPSEKGADVWISKQMTKGASDLYVQSNTWLPGGSTGWHTHPGHSLIIVTAGTITEYDADDPTCTPHTYTATPGTSVGTVDIGGGHVHIIRNEGNTVAQTMAVQLIPAGAARKIDAPAPANCANIQ
jgi:hypothetical protein